jgi:hypothetical protein
MWFIPSETTVLALLEYDSADFLCASRDKGVRYMVKGMRDRRPHLALAPKETFLKIFQQRPDLLETLAEVWFLNLHNDAHIPTPLAMQAAIFELVGMPELVNHIPLSQEKWTEVLDDFLDGLDQAANASSKNPQLLCHNMMAVLRRKEALWGDDFTTNLEARLDFVATWCDAAANEMLQKNTGLSLSPQDERIPYPLLTAAANLQGVLELLYCVRAAVVRGDEPMPASLPVPDLFPEELAEWWKKYTVQHGNPTAMTNADRICKALKPLAATTVEPSHRECLLDLVTIDRLTATEKYLALNRAEEAQKNYFAAVRADKATTRAATHGIQQRQQRT